MRGQGPSDIALQLFPLALRRHGRPGTLSTHALSEIVMIVRQSLGPGDRLNVTRFSLIAPFTNHDPVGIVRIITWRTNRQRWTMIEDDLPEYHPRFRNQSNVPFLPEHNLDT
jgi:hypothetical protein